MDLEPAYPAPASASCDTALLALDAAREALQNSEVSEQDERAALCRLANELGMTRPELESLAAIRLVLEKLEQPDVAWVAHGASSCSFTSWENKILGLLLTTVVDRLEDADIVDLNAVCSGSPEVDCFASTQLTPDSLCGKDYAVCWGQELSGGTKRCAQVPQKSGMSFRNRFCSECHTSGLVIHASRLRVVCGGCMPTNKHTGGIWNEGANANEWPPHRVVNQIFTSIGPPIVILKDVTSAPLLGLASMPHGESGWIKFRVGRTLEPAKAWQPASYLSAASGVFVHSAPCTAAPTPSATLPTANAGSAPTPAPRPFLPAIPTTLMPTHALPVAMAVPMPPSAAYAGRASRASPSGGLVWPPPATPPSSPPEISTSRMPSLQYIKPVQVSLALVVVVAAYLAELYTSPPVLLATAGCGLLALANIAQTSPRFLSRAMVMFVVCAPPLHMIGLLVRSPAELASDLDQLAGAGRYVITGAAAMGACFGVLPPSTLPPARKLLSAGYCACVMACSCLIVRVRTGDERQPSFTILHAILPCLASFLVSSVAAGRLLQCHVCGAACVALV